MIIETTINLKNKSKEELILLLNESLGVIKKLQKENEELKNIAIDMINKESQYKKFKLNAGEKQENIKFPEEYRNKINNMILDILKVDENAEVFDNIHSNKFFI